jgi:hypothetical protein
MALIPKVDANREYKLSGATLNSLIDAANSWANLRVEQIVSATEVTRLIRSPSGAVLRIVVPPVEASSGGAGNYRVLTQAMTVAGVVPTTTEISTALAAAYTSPDPDLTPADGDFVILTVSGTGKFAFDIRESAVTASGMLVRSFVVNATTYYAIGRQLGLY